MIGGAGSGFSTLFSDFETYYNLLKTLIVKCYECCDLHINV